MDPLSAAQSFTVTAEDTARAWGSGDLEVLATPRLVAWAEAVTVAATRPLLREGHTSVGTRVQVDHLKALPVGSQLEVSATAVFTEPKLVRYTVAARAGKRLVATGEITRVVVHTERFLARIS